MPRRQNQGGAYNILLLIVLAVIALIGFFIVVAGLTFGIGGFFWSSLGVIGVLVALVVLFLFIGLPILAIAYLASRAR